MRVSDLRAEWPQLARHEFDRLVAHAAGVARAQLAGLELDDGAVAEFARLAQRRLAGEPLQYIEGTVSFGPLELISDERALIPRPETEQLWERVVAMAESPRVVVDLCTGSGNLALACKHQWPDARVLGIDLSPAAIELAAENAGRTDLGIELLVGDLFEPLSHSLRGSVDVIVSNPPYLRTDERDALPGEVRRHEPDVALVAGPRGDEVLRCIAEQSPRWLRPGGLVACEISEFRSDEIELLFADLGGVVGRDLAGKPRFVFGVNEMSEPQRSAYEALRRGAVAGVPTDTVYGLAASAYSREGVDRLFAIKERSRSKPLPILAASVDQVGEVAIVDDRLLECAAGDWPGNVTYVVRRRPAVPEWIGDAGSATVGVRVPAHDRLLALMRRTGPLAVSSANLSGDPEVFDDVAARRLFGDDVDAYLPGRSFGSAPSSVIDITGEVPKILR